MDYKKIISSKELRFRILKALRFVPDHVMVKLQYYLKFGKKLHLDNPVSFQEKLQWLKLYYRKPEFTDIVDKIEAKKWVAERIGEEYIIPTYAEWDKAKDIDLSRLPESFVLKCNHLGGSYGVYLVPDKKNFDLKSAKKLLEKGLKYSLYDSYREWPYKDIRRRIFAEKLLGVGIEDFKFFCYNGFVESVMVAYERSTGHPKFYFFDRDWKLKRYNIRGKEAPDDFTMPRPENIDKMFEIASTLSKGFPFVRVDLYNVNGRIYFGEMTFFPASGLDEKLLVETDDYFGTFVELPKQTNL